jgi:uncharacterized membrane protein
MIPPLGVVVGIVLSLVTIAIDRRYENGLLSRSIVGNGADAQSILTTIATAVVMLTSVVLTVTLVAVQLAMGAVLAADRACAARWPRRPALDRDLRCDPHVRDLLVARDRHRARRQGGAGVTVLTALALAAASAFALFVFVHHAGQQLRVGALVDLVGDELRGHLDQRFPAAPAPREDAYCCSRATTAT